MVSLRCAWNREWLSCVVSSPHTDMVRRPIDVFIHYEGKRAADVVASRYAVRTLVAQAVSCAFYV